MPDTERKRKLIAVIAREFVERGYRGSTTAKLADACRVRENVLYRFWPSKKAMFLDAIQLVYDSTFSAWQRVLSDRPDGMSGAEAILSHQARDHGQMRLYRIVFAGLLEADAEILAALRQLYRRFHSQVTELIKDRECSLDVEETAWALIGIGAMVDVQRELRLLPNRAREQFMLNAGKLILDAR